MQPRDDGLDGVDFLGRDYEPRVERVDQGAADVLAGRLACVSRMVASRRCPDPAVGDALRQFNLCTASR